MIGWRSMDSAPRDGTRIVGWFGDKAIVVRWREGKKYAHGRPIGDTAYWSSGYYRHPEPDCWQPEPRGPGAAA